MSRSVVTDIAFWGGSFSCYIKFSWVTKHHYNTHHPERMYSWNFWTNLSCSIET